MEKHSPGPWVEENDGLITDADGNGVGDIYLSEDANLVCAAPELLNVVKRGVDGLSQGACLTCGSEPGVNIDCAGCRWVSDAEAVIAKAEGK
jgi:hypothetical protein